MSQLTNEATNQILISIKEELDRNGGKLSKEFVENYAKKCTYEYGAVGDYSRICILTTTNGNRMLGSALSLEPNDPDEPMDTGAGAIAAKAKCIPQLWSFLGQLAKTLA